MIWPLTLVVWFSTLWLRPVVQTSHWMAQVYGGPFGEVRAQFLSHIAGVSKDAKALVAGLSIGDTSLLSNATKDAMKVVSLTHLTAVSGANCAIVIVCVFLLLRKLAIARWLRWLVGMLALIGYLLLVGPQPSVLRAAVMAAIVVTCVQLGRKTSPTHALGLAVIALLLADPGLATDYGFQLSVLATLGILQLAPALTLRFKQRLPTWLALALAISLSAQLLCLPVLLQLQPGLSTYSIPANIIAEPLVAPITILGMLACVLAPFMPWLAVVLSWVASLGGWLIVQIAKVASELPIATLSWPAGSTGVLLSVLLITAVVALVRSKGNRVRLLGGLLVGVFLVSLLGGCVGKGIRAANWPPVNWSVVSCDVGQGDGTVLQSDGSYAVIDVGRKPAPIRSCLRKLGIKRVDLLVLTHFDLDHVGGLDGLLDTVEVTTAIITSYHDERPAASITYRKLRREVGSMISAGKGMSGRLGEFDWRVLSPHLGAAEAEDSNDGSVTMLFSSPELDVLTLADLGEKGQMRLAAESAEWLGNGFGGVPLVVKVSHHGSADQYPELYEALKPQIALFSVGAHNDYGHPTKRTLDLLNRVGAREYRTDLQGSIAITEEPEGLRVSTAGGG